MIKKKPKNPKDFQSRVIAIVKNIPRGEVLSYQEVAKRAGSAQAARAVGTIMKANFLADVPCHRVIRTDGLLGLYNRGKSKKEALLKKEGVTIQNHRIVRS